MKTHIPVHADEQTKIKIHLFKIKTKIFLNKINLFIIMIKLISYEECTNECGLTTLETIKRLSYYTILNCYENIDRNIFLNQER